MSQITDLRSALNVLKARRIYGKALKNGVWIYPLHRCAALESTILYVEARLLFELGSNRNQYHGVVAA